MPSTVKPRTYGMPERSDRLDFYIRDEATRRAITEPHRHAYFQIQFNLGGDTEQQIGGVTRPFSRGALAFVLPYREHLIPHPPGAHFIVINFSLAFLRADLDVDPLDLEDVSTQRAPELAPFRFQEHLDFILTGAAFDDARRIAQRMLETDRARTFGSVPLLRGYLLQLIGLVCTQYAGPLTKLAQNGVHRAGRRDAFARVLRHVRANLTNDALTLAGTARAAFLSPNYLAHLIRKETGGTFTDLVTERRIALAQSLLAPRRGGSPTSRTRSAFATKAISRGAFARAPACRRRTTARRTARPTPPSREPPRMRRTRSAPPVQKARSGRPRSRARSFVHEDDTSVAAACAPHCYRRRVAAARRDAWPGVPLPKTSASVFAFRNPFRDQKMTDYVFAPPAVPSVEIAGSAARFPVRRVFCVGRNYADHAREMGADPNREPPFFFSKPADAIVPASGTVPYPTLTSDLHHEIELVIAIGRGGRAIAADSALDHVWGYGVGVDLTRRDLQAEAKKAGRPWDWAKGFDASGPLTALHPAASIGHPQRGRIWLAVNDDARQQGDLADMIWPITDIVSYASRAVELRAGDLIFTGTPAGVAALQPGDRVTGGVDGVASFEFVVGEKPAA